MAVAISVDKTIVSPGTTVTATITGLANYSTAILSWTVGGTSSSYSLYADGSGNATSAYVMPNSMQGTCTVSVIPAAAAATTTTVTVMPGG